MGKLTSYGQIANDFAREVYKNQRKVVELLVKSGKILAENADKEWAKRVSAELIKNGLKVSQKILKMMK